MFRVKLRGRQPIRPLQTIRRRNNRSISITHQALITAEAVPAKVKRATDPEVTATATSTRAGASKVRPGPWVSQVQVDAATADYICFSELPFREGYLRTAFVEIVLGPRHLLTPDGFPPSFPSYSPFLRPQVRIPSHSWRAGVSFFLLLFFHHPFFLHSNFG